MLLYWKIRVCRVLSILAILVAVQFQESLCDVANMEVGDMQQPQQQTWKTPVVNQPIPDYNVGGIATAERFGTPASNNNYNGREQQFDERISDIIAENVLRFAHGVGQHLGEQTQYTKSEVFSPVSIMSALSLLMLGAKGRSYQELQQVCGLNLDNELLSTPRKFHLEFGKMLEDIQSNDAWRTRKNSNWRVTQRKKNNSVRGTTSKAQVLHTEHITKVANGLFAQEGYSLNPDYRSVIRSVYNSDVITLDFRVKSREARDTINQWVHRNTNGKISNIINGEIEKSTNVILASSLYFKAFWETPFIVAGTTIDDFYPDGLGQGSPVRIPMMPVGGVFPFYNSVENNCRIIGLPYQGNLTTMYVIVPYDSNRAKLKQLQRHLDARKIENMISKMTMKTAVMAFPKMHMTRSLNMRDVLHQMGVRDIFYSGISDLSLLGMQEVRPINIEEIQPQNSPLAPINIQPVANAQPEASVQYSQPAFDIRTEDAAYQGPMDRFNGKPLIFTRFGGVEDTSQTSSAISNSNVATGRNLQTGRYFEWPQTHRGKRQALNKPLINRANTKENTLDRLEQKRNTPMPTFKSDLFVEDIVHKVDFDLNEQGTEAAAATATYLRRSGTDVVLRVETPFMFLIRHDPTKLVLFYGVVNEPQI